MGQNMDRAEKVKKYRRKMMKNRKKRKQQLFGASGAGWSGTGAVFAGLLAAIIFAVLFFMLHHKKNTVQFTYVTREEFASMMSFFMEDAMSEQWLENGTAAVTYGELKEFVLHTGLSGTIPVKGGKDRIERSAFMDYYDQILDYLDLEEAVSRETVLLLAQDGNICQTQEGERKFYIDTVRLEPFYTYTVYLMDQTIIGVRGESDKTIPLRQVRIQSVLDELLAFTWQEKEYQIPCRDAEGIAENTEATLCIKDGRVTKIKDAAADGVKADSGKKQTSDPLPETVHVLLLKDGNIHYDPKQQIYLSCDGGFSVKQKEKKQHYEKSDVISVKKFRIKKGSCMIAEPDREDNRLYFTEKDGRRISNGYYGSLLIYRDKQGYYAVNKVKIEKYLYSVVASEMPASFGLEALKAQAVCARSYVYKQMTGEEYSRYHAQIDDSTNYQVYNKSEISEEDIRAVEATAGEIMYAGEDIVNAYYFSSSFGYTSSMEIWNQKEEDYPYLKAKSLNPELYVSGSSAKQTKKSAEKENTVDLSDEDDFRKFITSKKAASYDSSSRYFRWTAKAEPSACVNELKEKIAQRRKINPDNITFYAADGKKYKKVNSLKGFGGVKKIFCSRRGRSGAILVLTIAFEFGKVEIRSEYNIRSILGCAMEQITYADGTADTSSRFLPSAYFSISFHKKSRRYIFTGGGNGHGMGMSQYGAASMAKDGWDYEKILKFFYDGVTIEKAGENSWQGKES